MAAVVDGLLAFPIARTLGLLGRAGAAPCCALDGITVVIYDDDENAMLATRLWWVLAYYGHEKASVLNGGWRRWMAEKRPITFGEEPPRSGRSSPLARTRS